MECTICNSNNVKYKNSKKDFAIGKLLCRKCYNNLYKQTDEYKEWKSNYDIERYNNNKEDIKSRTKQYYSDNLEKCLENRKNYYILNKGNFLYYSKFYKHKKLKATPKWLTEQHKKEIKEVYNLANQLTLLTGIEHEVDHIIPIKSEIVSGLHVPWNLQVLTRKENRAKSNKLV